MVVFWLLWRLEALEDLLERESSLDAHGLTGADCCLDLSCIETSHLRMTATKVVLDAEVHSIEGSQQSIFVAAEYTIQVETDTPANHST